MMEGGGIVEKYLGHTECKLIRKMDWRLCQVLKPERSWPVEDCPLVTVFKDVKKRSSLPPLGVACGVSTKHSGEQQQNFFSCSLLSLFLSQQLAAVGWTKIVCYLSLDQD